jgi:hypothetical protein
MKRNFNLSVYNLLGYVLLAVAAYAFVNARNTDVIATSPVAEETTQPRPNRHTITLVLSQLSDLKVEEGQRINVGDIISPKGLASRPIALPKKPNYKPKDSD